MTPEFYLNAHRTPTGFVVVVFRGVGAGHTRWLRRYYRAHEMHLARRLAFDWCIRFQPTHITGLAFDWAREGEWMTTAT